MSVKTQSKTITRDSSLKKEEFKLSSISDDYNIDDCWEDLNKYYQV